MIKSKGFVRTLVFVVLVNERIDQEMKSLYTAVIVFHGAYQVFEKLPQLKVKWSCLRRFSPF
jgi:hypothetical protein